MYGRRPPSRSATSADSLPPKTSATLSSLSLAPALSPLSPSKTGGSSLPLQAFRRPPSPYSPDRAPALADRAPALLDRALAPTSSVEPAATLKTRDGAPPELSIPSKATPAAVRKAGLWSTAEGDSGADRSGPRSQPPAQQPGGKPCRRPPPPPSIRGGGEKNEEERAGPPPPRRSSSAPTSAQLTPAPLLHLRPPLSSLRCLSPTSDHQLCSLTTPTGSFKHLDFRLHPLAHRRHSSRREHHR